MEFVWLLAVSALFGWPRAKKQIDEEDVVAQEENHMATMGIDEIDKVVFSYTELGRRVGCGTFSITKTVKSGFSKEESTSATFSMEVTAAAEYSSAFASASMQATVGATTASSMTTVTFKSSERSLHIAAPDNCATWYAYQTAQAIYYKNGKRLIFRGSVWTNNAPLQPITVHRQGAALARSWRKAPGLQYLVTEAFRGGVTAHNMYLWGWREDRASFYVFTQRSSRPGLEAVHSYRKGQHQQLELESWPSRWKMSRWGWRDEGIAFYAWPLDKAPVGAQEVLLYRKGEMRFYCLRSWEKLHMMGIWRWQLHKKAFKVPAAPF